MGPSMQLLFILKWPITEIEKTSKSLKTHSMESIHAKIKSKGMSKLENLPKINIIEEYLLGVPFLRKSTSVIPFQNSVMIFIRNSNLTTTIVHESMSMSTYICPWSKSSSLVINCHQLSIELNWSGPRLRKLLWIDDFKWLRGFADRQTNEWMDFCNWNFWFLRNFNFQFLQNNFFF